MRHTANVSRPQAGFLACDQVDIRACIRGLVHKLGGTVGGVVVNDKNVHVVRQKLELTLQCRDQLRDIAALVVRWHDDHDLHVGSLNNVPDRERGNCRSISRRAEYYLIYFGSMCEPTP